jgi:hypothetical protein
LREQYPGEPWAGDITFLDFFGGAIAKDDPFAEEIGALRSYFMKHANHPGRAFIFAWTYATRDRGKAKYVSALERVVQEASLLAKLRQAEGVLSRSIAVRLLLWQMMKEHGLSVSIVQHLIYKRTMSAIILVFSKGLDPSSSHELSDPSCLLTDSIWTYQEDIVTPTRVKLDLLA